MPKATVRYNTGTGYQIEVEADGIPGSDLGQALTRLADRIEHANLVLRMIIEQADV
jgi:hypothetical protein